MSYHKYQDTRDYIVAPSKDPRPFGVPKYWPSFIWPDIMNGSKSFHDHISSQPALYQPQGAMTGELSSKAS